MQVAEIPVKHLKTRLDEGQVNKGEGTYLLLFGAFVTAIVYFATTLNVGYYSKADLFGPVSKFPTVFVSLAIGVALSMTYVFVHVKWRSKSVFHLCVLASPIVLLILYLLFLPDATEKYVFTNYNDVIDQMSRTAYVVATGKSNIRIDSYFDLQPAAFYATAALLTVTGIAPYTIFKWFPLLFVIIAYVPSLFFLGKSFFKDPRELVLFVFLSLATMWVPVRYHYSPQVYVLPIYNLLVAILVRRRSRSDLTILVIMCAAIVPTHEGISLFVLVTFVSVGLVNVLERFIFGRTEGSETLLRIAILFSIIWLGYLGWLTMYTLSDFVHILKQVGDAILAEGFFRIFSGAVARPDLTYQLLVYGKILFAAIIYSLSLPVLAYWWLKKRMRKSGVFLMIVLGVSVTVFVLGFSLGGAGYVDRAVLVTGPLLATGLTILTSRILGKPPFARESQGASCCDPGGIEADPHREYQRVCGRSPNRPSTRQGRSAPVRPIAVIAVMLISLTVTSAVLFNSSRNFQSMTFSEQACTEFLVFHVSSPIRITSGVTITVARYSYGQVGDISKMPSGIFALFPSFLIESSYWVPEEVLANVTAGPTRMSDFLRFYSNGICPIYLVNAPA